ncbi:MAG: DNA-protecting protein DprA, partial [Candidatus Levybacteria bacterium]|nr:DNA-protecting protein DprA [Candidatus Levybacteria bacterium]
MDEKIYYLSFSLSPGVGPKGFQNLLKLLGSAQNAWKGSSSDFKKAGIGKANFAKFDGFRREFDIQEYLRKLKRARVEFIPFGDKYYPERLKKIESQPIGLFTKGNHKLLVGPQIIAVVGTRKITSYGREVTENLVSELCSSGFVIVSGMALGVDGIGHKSAIDSRGSTIAVLGCGVDCPYPRENEKLYEEILDSNGLIVSEYPLGMPANQGTFPARNRIIAGISSAVLITEAAQDSGSLITAGHAVKQGKPVFAVPGPITSQMSKGTLKLLKQGAVLVSSTEDILSELKVKSQNSKFKIESQKLKVLGKDE